MRKDNRFLTIYKKLLKLHGPQGWWPIDSHYHTRNFDIPRNEAELFEICLGAILTQNTSFTGVEKALFNLKNNHILAPEQLIKAPEELIKNCIRPAGYFNQKNKKILIFADFFLKLRNIPSRDELLNLWGIGPETADSMLLYGWHIPSFVVDAYTKRIFTHLKFIKSTDDYHAIKAKFESNLPKDYKIYNEYHALIVRHAKTFYGKKPYGINCPLKNYLSSSS